MREASLSASRLSPFSEERAAPKRRGAARSVKDRPSVLARVFSLKRMAVLLVMGIAGLAAIGVPMNALFFQEGRHPAPLFSAHAPAGDVAATPRPPARPADLALAHSEAETAKAEPVRAPGKSEHAKLEAAKPAAAKPESNKPEPGKNVEDKARDLIGQFLTGGAPQAEASNKGVLYAQRALLKLGYVLRADGVFGGATRQAIEKFERDNGFPVKGEITPKIMRQLAARSGLARQ